MRARQRWRLAGRELKRSAQHFALASIGVVLGVAAFGFFVALGLGVKEVVLKQVFAVDELEVIPRRMNLDVGPLRLDAGRGALDDAAAETLAALPGVEAVFPKMKLVVPAIGQGGEALFGRDLEMELAVDGIAPEIVQQDVGRGYVFDNPGQAAGDASDEGPACDADAACPEHNWCSAGHCDRMVPVLVSQHLIEVYNGSLSRVHALPKLSPTALNGFTFDINVGDSMVESAVREQRVKVRAEVVGISSKALPLGITIPLEYVRRFNTHFEGPAAASAYHSIVLKAEHEKRLGEVAGGVADQGFEVKDSGAERAAMLIAVFMLVFTLVAGAIIFISAINVMHVLLMLVAQRAQELGVFRALGATRSDIRRLIVVEAAALGAVASLSGLLLAYAAARAFDAASGYYLPDFPYKPDTYFMFPPWLWLAGLSFGVVFCALGALAPANRAARLEPARVLSNH